MEASTQTCYRHPGRETNVSCSNCGRPICPDCMTPSPVGMRCPECSREKQKVVTGQQVRDRAEGVGIENAFRVMPVTMTLIVINVIVFVAEILSAGTLTTQIRGEVMQNGAFWGPGVAAGDWWRIITAGFLHLGIFHIAMNMLLLWLLGQLLEPAIGSLRFGIVYFTSLIAGSLGALLLEPTTAAVGASGAVFGLMGAAMVAFWGRGLNPFEAGIGGLLVFNLIITFAIPGISKGGHIGGAIGGFIAGAVIFYLEEKFGLFGRARWAAPLICAGIGAACFVLTIVIAENKFPQYVGT